MPDIVYVLTNPTIPGLVKIGFTTDLQKRMEDLYNTSVPDKFECVIAWQVLTGTGRTLEKDLHITFAPDRRSPSREWFKTDPERVKAFLRNVPGKDVTPNTEPSPEAPESKEEKKSNPGTREKTERNQEMLQAWREGKSYAEIARKYEVSATFARKTIKRLAQQ